MGVIKRGSKLWIRFKDGSGKWRNVAANLDVGQEELAQAKYEALVAAVRDSKATESSGPLTVRAFATPWLEERKELDLDWQSDRSWLNNHILPKIGDMPIASVRTRHLIAMFHAIRTRESPLSQRSIYNINSTLSALFRDAKLADKIEQTPCCLDERQLGPLRDKNPEWRSLAVFTRDEAQTIISTPDIPDDRRIVYALELLAGVRPGEASALRWRHYDREAVPLGHLLVAMAYSTRKGRAKSTKTDVVKHVPVHPTLAAMLAEWKLSGWAAMMGRSPGPDDLIVPLPPAAAARRRTRTGEAFRGHDYSGKRWREDDLKVLGWRHRQHYNMRSTFITLALEDGADPDVIEQRVTHTKKSRGAFQGYVRSSMWSQTCAEVAKLQIVRTNLAIVPVLVAASGEGEPGLVTGSSQSVEVSMIASENRGGGGSRTGGYTGSTTLGTTGSQRLSSVPAPPNHVERREPVTSPLQLVDPIASGLDAARVAWDADGDRKRLRRALLALLGELE